MNIKKFWKLWALFALAAGLVLAGCDFVSSEEEEEESGGSENSGGSETLKNALVEDVWTDGIFSKDGQTDTWSIVVSKGTRYFIWLNNAYEGDGTKTAKTGLKISHSDGTVISSSYDDVEKCWIAPFTFLAPSAGTVTITAATNGYSWEKTGTYAIKYTSRPEYDVLSEEEWQDDIIIAAGQTNKYSMSVVSGTRYFIWLNNAYEGDGTKTAKTGLKISHSDGTVISSSYDDVEKCWIAPFTFLAPSTGTVTITAATNGYSWEKTGTYAIKYTSRPEYDALSNGEWKNDSVIATGQTNKYSMDVTAGTRYFVYLNSAYEGDGTKTAKTGLKISHSDGTVICNNYNNAYRLFEKPYTFLVPCTGTVTITVASESSGWERGTGTYAIRCTFRPEYDALSNGEWKNDSIIATGQTNKYSINVVAGTQYSIYLNDGYEGDGSKTANEIGLKIIYTQDSNSDNPVICNSYSSACKLYVKPYTFTAPSTGTIIITAAVYSSGWENGIGTYAIKYMSGS